MISVFTTASTVVGMAGLVLPRGAQFLSHCRQAVRSETSFLVPTLLSCLAPAAAPI